MRWRPCCGLKKPAAEPEKKATSGTPPLPDNPYRRFYTVTPTFEDLVRRAKEGGTEQKT